jgi:TonB family protein
VRVPGFLVLFLVSAAATALAQAQSLGAAQPNQPAGLPASPANGTNPTLMAPIDCTQFYPRLAVRLHEKGVTTLSIHVTATGTVADIAVKKSSGSDELDRASIKCAQAWKLHPATQNGIPVEATIERSLRWDLMNVEYWPSIPYRPPGPPAGWEHDNSTTMTSELLASYKLSGALSAEQYLVARANHYLSNLDAFVVEIDKNLKGIKDLHVLSEGPIALCNGEPASELEYSQPGLVADPDRILDIEQIRTVKNGWAYVTTYIRPAESSKRPDAERWIYGFCAAPG